MERFEFHLQSSHWLTRYVFAVHLFAVAVIWWFQVAISLQVISTLLVVIGLVFVMRRNNRGEVVLTVDGDQWHLQRGDDVVEVALLPSCYISRWLTILPLGLPKEGTLRLLVPFDSLGAEQYRRLKVQVRLGVLR